MSSIHPVCPRSSCCPKDNLVLLEVLISTPGLPEAGGDGAWERRQSKVKAGDGVPPPKPLALGPLPGKLWAESQSQHLLTPKD